MMEKVSRLEDLSIYTSLVKVCTLEDGTKSLYYFEESSDLFHATWRHLRDILFTSDGC